MTGPQIYFAASPVGVPVPVMAGGAAAAAASSAAAARRRREREQHDRECAELGCAPPPPTPVEPWNIVDYGFVLLLVALFLGFVAYMLKE